MLRVVVVAVVEAVVVPPTYHTLEPGPIETSPITVAVGATKAAAEAGTLPPNATLLVDATSFSVMGTACTRGGGLR